jgi:hypothetical protein
MFVLDTDILTLLFAGHSRVLSRRNQVSSADIATTVISRIQSLQGRFQFLLKAASGAELLRAQRLLEGTIRALTQIETDPRHRRCRCRRVRSAAARQKAQKDRPRRSADRGHYLGESGYPGYARRERFPPGSGLADRELG